MVSNFVSCPRTLKGEKGDIIVTHNVDRESLLSSIIFCALLEDYDEINYYFINICEEITMITKDVGIAVGQLEKLFAVAFAPVVALTELIKNSSDACVNKNDTISINIDTNHHTIKVKDNGKGFSKSDIEGLSTIGISEKMVADNILSAIGEPYAGSKGLGFLTAFNLCERLEVNTFSQKDGCGYKIQWKKGSSQISYGKSDKAQAGTEIVLFDVKKETIFLLTHNSELIKLYLSSITYYIENKNLPKIELYKDGVRFVHTPLEKIESLYEKNKKKKNSGYFIAKGSFKYTQDKLVLSYEDNELNLFSYANEELDLTNINSLIDFQRRNKLYIPRLRRWYDELAELGDPIDDFEGVYYVWRDRKDTSANYPPYGIRVYVNNYGLYNYLDKDNDWLQHSLISQNVKVTNYKHKNTYGYVNFKHFSEANSKLIISQERNDFSGNLARMKFMHIMKNFVTGIFTQTDITMKNHKPDGDVNFEQKAEIRAIELGQPIRISDFIKTNLSFGLYDIDCGDGVLVEENGSINVLSAGEFHLTFTYEGISCPCKIIVREKTPAFALKKPPKIDEGNSQNLRELIAVSSLKHIDLYAIEITSTDADIQGDIFTGKNLPGPYTITYSNNDFLPISHTLQLTVNKTFQAESKKVEKLFPDYHSANVPVKIQEIIEGISEAYIRHPTLCMIGLRTLLEICLREFRSRFGKENKENFDDTSKPLESRLHTTLKLAFSKECLISEELQKKYENHLSGKARIKLAEELAKLDLNTYVHNPAVVTDSARVLSGLRIFKNLINFIIEAFATA